MQLLEKYIPQLVKDHKAELKTLIQKDAIFTLCTAIDYISIAQHLKNYMTEPDIIKRCEELEASAMDFLSAGVGNLLKGEKTEEYAGDLLIPKLFDKYRYINRKDNMTNIAVYSAINGMQYSGHPDAYPPWAKYEKFDHDKNPTRRGHELHDKSYK